MPEDDLYSQSVLHRKSLLSLVLCLSIVGLFEPELLEKPYVWLMKKISSGGLRVTYYSGQNFERLEARRVERRIMRDYGLGRPTWGMSKGPFSARWEGILLVPQDAEYSFYLQSCNGSRLWIDDKLIIDRWGDHGWIPGRHGAVQLPQGRHRIRIEHYNRTGNAALRLKWSGGGIPDNTVLGTPYLLKQ